VIESASGNGKESGNASVRENENGKEIVIETGIVTETVIEIRAGNEDLAAVAVVQAEPKREVHVPHLLVIVVDVIVAPSHVAGLQNVNLSVDPANVLVIGLPAIVFTREAGVVALFHLLVATINDGLLHLLHFLHLHLPGL